jgi:hypothetical protein
VQDEGESPLPALFFQDRGDVVVSAARMDDERQAGLPRGRNVGAEAGGLRRPWRLVVMASPIATTLGCAESRISSSAVTSGSSAALCGCVPTEQ